MEFLKPSPANSSPLTPLGFLDRAATVYGDCPSIIYNDTIHTWSQTHNRCLRLASSLSSIGISTGHVVFIYRPLPSPALSSSISLLCYTAENQINKIQFFSFFSLSFLS